MPSQDQSAVRPSRFGTCTAHLRLLGDRSITNSVEVAICVTAGSRCPPSSSRLTSQNAGTASCRTLARTPTHVPNRHQSPPRAPLVGDNLVRAQVSASRCRADLASAAPHTSDTTSAAMVSSYTTPRTRVWNDVLSESDSRRAAPRPRFRCQPQSGRDRRWSASIPMVGRARRPRHPPRPAR